MKTNKIFSAVMAAAMLLSSGALPASAVMTGSPAQSVEYQTGASTKVNSKYVYKITGKNSVTLLGFKKKAITASGRLNIPSKIGARKVTKLSEKLNESFDKYIMSIDSVKIPSTVKSINNTIMPYYMWSDESRPRPKVDKVQKIKFYCYHGTEGEAFAARMGYNYKLTGDGKDALTAPRINKKVTVKGQSATISWAAVAGAESYIVYRTTVKYDDFYNMKPSDWSWEKAAELKSDTLSFTDNELPAGSTEPSVANLAYYKVVAVRGSEKSPESAVKGVAAASETELELLSTGKYDTGEPYLEFAIPHNDVGSGDGVVYAEITDPYDGKWYPLGETEYSDETF
ncbi:MAG: hypothetical protein IJ723_01300, partial [Ruminococcus sp.]|nr:hypothetical protein [Ruminococcus sp.]